MSGEKANLTIGARGERFAAAIYEKRGDEVLCRNYRTRTGEIDLIVRSGDVLRFVEVKTRKVDSLLLPEEAVTPKKQRRIVLAAMEYLESQNWNGSISMDIFELYLENERPRRYRILENAFSWPDDL